MKALEMTEALGHGFLHTHHATRQEEPMAPMTYPQRRAYQAKQRRLQKARERLQHEQARAQRHLQALQQALGDLDLPEILAEGGQLRLNAITKMPGKIFGAMFAPLVGCRTHHEPCRVRGWG